MPGEPSPHKRAGLGGTVARKPSVPTGFDWVSAAIGAMQRALAALAEGGMPRGDMTSFADLRALLGFEAYDAEAERYAAARERSRLQNCGSD